MLQNGKLVPQKKMFLSCLFHVCDFLQCSFCIQKGQHLELQLLSFFTEGSVV